MQDEGCIQIDIATLVAYLGGHRQSALGLDMSCILLDGTSRQLGHSSGGRGEAPRSLRTGCWLPGPSEIGIATI